MTATAEEFLPCRKSSNQPNSRTARQPLLLFGVSGSYQLKPLRITETAVYPAKLNQTTEQQTKMARMKGPSAGRISSLTARLAGTQLQNPADTKLSMRRAYSGTAGLPESSLPGQAAPQHGSDLPNSRTVDLSYKETDS